jgi:predicted signal transduction protein with EAL and GGDEF domain
VSSLAIFLVGFVILVAGLAYGASLAGLSPQWITVGVLVLLGIGIAMGVTRTRQRDPSHD